MKAVVCTRYGPPEVLRLTDRREPRPGRDGVLIRVHSTAVTASDCIVRGLRVTGWRRTALRLAYGVRGPRGVLGMVAAGEVEAVGPRVTRFAPGDRVFGMGGFRFGAYAEKLCWSAGTTLATMPEGLTFDDAAAVPYGGLMASHFMRRLNVRKGIRVLIYGASGAIGTSAVQLARHLGAEVTGVCSTTNLDLVRSLGASTVIAYTRDDFTRGDDRYDVVFDAVGRRKSGPALAGAARVLAPGGAVMSVDDGTPRMTVSDLLALRQLWESGELRPVIDRRYPLDQIVEAHRYVEQGHKRGNVIVMVAR